MNKKCQNAGLSLESLLDAFKAWRRQSKRCQRIPQELWDKAVMLCDDHSIGRVHRVLGLSYIDLKERVLKNRSSVRTKKFPLSPFVELRVPSKDQFGGLPNSQYLIELSRPDSSQMKIYSSKNDPVDINNLCSTFLKS